MEIIENPEKDQWPNNNNLKLTGNEDNTNWYDDTIFQASGWQNLKHVMLVIIVYIYEVISISYILMWITSFNIHDSSKEEILKFLFID